jgi:Tol biopolymer transport system component
MTSGSKIVQLDRGGRRASEISLPGQGFTKPRLSPDDRRLALVSIDPGDEDIWVVDLETQKPSRLTFDKGLNSYPIWSPDNAHIAFQRRGSGAFDLWIRSSSGGGAEHALYESPTPWKEPGSWVGTILAFVDIEQGTGWDISLLRTDRPNDPPVSLLKSAASEWDPAISPDGRWLAYTSNESGRDEIFVVSMPDAKTKYQVTTEGGRGPIWARGGRELLFAPRVTQVGSVDVSGGASLSFGKPTTLFSMPFTNSGTDAARGAGFDVSKDGNRIFMLTSKDETPMTLVVVTDWLAELRAREKE